MPENSQHVMIDAVRRYFAACNSGAREDFIPLFLPDAAHYLPKGMFGPILDVDSLFRQWRLDAEENGSYWSLEACYCDLAKSSVIAEWTAIKPAQEMHYRGVDIFIFDINFLIREVRVYYATARNPALGPNELGGFDYHAAGWWVPGRDKGKD